MDIAELERQNKAKGICPNCGGSGVVAAMAAINRTGDPHVNRRCGKCKGSGKYTPPAAARREPER